MYGLYVFRDNYIDICTNHLIKELFKFGLRPLIGSEYNALQGINVKKYKIDLNDKVQFKKICKLKLKKMYKLKFKKIFELKFKKN